MAKQIRTEDSLARNFLKKTIQKEYKQIREKCFKANAPREYFSSINVDLIRNFVGPYQQETIRQDFEDGNKPYCRMDLVSLYIYNQYLGRIAQALNTGYSIDQSIAIAAKKCKSAPCVLTNRNEAAYAMSLAEMENSEKYIKDYISKVFKVDRNKLTINRSYEVKEEQQKIEAIRAHKREEKKLTKETQTAFAKRHGVSYRELSKLVKEGKSLNEIADFYASRLKEDGGTAKTKQDSPIIDDEDEAYSSKNNEIMFDTNDYPLTYTNGEYYDINGKKYTGAIHNEDYSIYDPQDERE